MPLAPIQLDDLTWSDLITSARDRIAAISGGEWTLHAPVDPGITFLELFAAQLEQRLYWMDQPDDSRTLALLKLAGFRSRPVGIAATVLCFHAPQEDGKRISAPIPRGTVMKLKDDARDLGSQLAFANAGTLTVVPVCERVVRGRAGNKPQTRPFVGLCVDGQDRTIELQAGRTPCLLPATGEVRDAEVVLWLTESSLGNEKIGNRPALSILFELDAPPQVQPQWIADSAADQAWGSAQSSAWDASFVQNGTTPLQKTPPVPPPARISWWYWTRRGFQEFSAQMVDDGTNGLRRSGIVRLPFRPSEWESDPECRAIRPDARNKDAGAFPFRLRIRARNATYSYAPRVKAIVPNVVIARHQRLRSTEIPKPGPPDAAFRGLNESAQRDLALQIFHWRPLPGNELVLPEDEFGDKPIPQFDPSDAGDRLDERDPRRQLPQQLVRPVKLRLRERDTPDHLDKSHWPVWSAVDDLGQSGPGERHFVVDRQSARLRFGDGLTGRVPVPKRFYDPDNPNRPRQDDPVEFELEYEVGGGAKANLLTEVPWTMADAAEDRQQGSSTAANPIPWAATNVVPALGGGEPESTDAAAVRAPLALKHRDRAVTLDDIVQLAEATPDVAIGRAHAAIGFLPQYACVPVPGAVTVFVVPDLPASLRRFHDRSCGDDLVALVPDAGAVQAVAEHLQRGRLLTHEIHVASPSYVQVALRVEIAGRPADPDDVRRIVTQSLHEYLHPLFGGAEGTGWPFGGPLRPSELIRRTQQALGDDLHVQRVEIGILDDTQPFPGSSGETGCRASARPCETAAMPLAGDGSWEACRDVEIRPHALVALRTITVSFSERGPSQRGGVF